MRVGEAAVSGIGTVEEAEVETAGESGEESVGSLADDDESFESFGGAAEAGVVDGELGGLELLEEVALGANRLGQGRIDDDAGLDAEVLHPLEAGAVGLVAEGVSEDEEDLATGGEVGRGAPVVARPVGGLRDAADDGLAAVAPRRDGGVEVTPRSEHLGAGSPRADAVVYGPVHADQVPPRELGRLGVELKPADVCRHVAHLAVRQLAHLGQDAMRRARPRRLPLETGHLDARARQHQELGRPSLDRPRDQFQRQLDRPLAPELLNRHVSVQPAHVHLVGLDDEAGLLFRFLDGTTRRSRQRLRRLEPRDFLDEKTATSRARRVLFQTRRSTPVGPSRRGSLSGSRCVQSSQSRGRRVGGRILEGVTLQATASSRRILSSSGCPVASTSRVAHRLGT
mmetsp:Transcript_17557/g.54872  ORF Transcript_17557/g.54872 Transcript_17557/m.54872 type:complete len:398 (+) Transcript_17557:276-1469(+)